MNFSVGLGRDDAEKRLEQNGVSRRDFMKFCATVWLPSPESEVRIRFTRPTSVISRRTNHRMISGC